MTTVTTVSVTMTTADTLRARIAADIQTAWGKGRMPNCYFVSQAERDLIAGDFVAEPVADRMQPYGMRPALDLWPSAYGTIAIIVSGS
jgi:hypothetical protein